MGNNFAPATLLFIAGFCLTFLCCRIRRFFSFPVQRVHGFLAFNPVLQVAFPKNFIKVRKAILTDNWSTHLEFLLNPEPLPIQIHHDFYMIILLSGILKRCRSSSPQTDRLSRNFARA